MGNIIRSKKTQAPATTATPDQTTATEPAPASTTKPTTDMSLPEIKSKDSLVKKYLTEEIWNKYKDHKTKTCGFTLKQCVICALELDNQHNGIYAGDHDSYTDFKDIFDPIILDYHGLKDGFAHKSDMDPSKLSGTISSDAVNSTRIRVGRNIEGFGLSPGITKEQRQEMEKLMIKAFESLEGEFAGTYYPLTGMEEATRQKLVDDHFLFMSGDPNLIISGMEREWPEGRGIFHNKDKTFLVWVNEEDQLRIISMQKGGDITVVFKRLSEGLALIEDSITKNGGGKKFSLDSRFGYITSCPTNLGTGMRASVHIDLPGWGKEGNDALKARCEVLALQPRGTRGESGGMTGHTYDISNKHRLGYSEVQLVQNMIDGVNKLVEEDKELQKKHGL